MDATPTRIVARRGFFPVVAGDQVSVKQAASTFVLSAGDLSLTQGGSQVVLTGGGLSIEQGGAQVAIVGGDAQVAQGGAGVLVAGAAAIDHGFVGVALARDLSLTDTKVLLGPRQAAAFGAGFGAIAVLVGLLVKRLAR